jgi:hypothetical protein
LAIGIYGERLADDGDLHTAALEHFRPVERRLVPFVVENILAEESKRQIFDDFLHAIRAVSEFPVRRHRVRLQGIHHVDHVLAARDQRRIAALPSIAAV